MGLTGCLANSYGMLGYLPFIEASPKHGRLSRFGRKLVERHQYLSAMVKLNLYLTDIQQIYQGNLSTIIPRYIEDCEEMNDENKVIELTPEELVGTHLCLPERIIGGPDPSEWTNIMFIKTFGVPDKLSTIDEHYPVQSSRSNRQEEMVKEKPANSGDKKIEINSSRNDTRAVADEKLDVEISDVIENSEDNLEI